MACGTRKTASTTTFCACPTAKPTRLEGPLHGGLLPLCAITVIEPWQRERVPRMQCDIHGASAADAGATATAFIRRGPATWAWRARHRRAGESGTGCAASCRACSTRTSSSALWHSRALALSRRASLRVRVDGQEYRVNYLPAESDSGMFGGNSNWRGPIWMPVNALIIRALLTLLPLLWR